MTINIRAKGQNGEREVQQALEPIVRRVMQQLGHPLPEKAIVQRNQNQSAVGGADLTGTFGLSIEVKRQESLSINTWWAQCVKAAQENNEIPVLLYRQNGKKWKAVLMVDVPLHNTAAMVLRAEISWDDFLGWFEVWVRRKLQEV